jgi:hypothetical protein
MQRWSKDKNAALHDGIKGFIEWSAAIDVPQGHRL